MADSTTTTNGDSLQGSSRRRLLAEYKASGAEIARATTRPYKSRLPFQWNVVNPLPAGAVTVAAAVLAKGFSQDYFSFGQQSQQIVWTPNFNKPVTQADTNQTQGHATNGIEDFVIEGMSHSFSAARVEYAAASFSGTIVDPDLVAFFLGQREGADPGLLAMSPQFASPFNLENPPHRVLRANVSIAFIWDNKNQIPIGTLDQLPEGAAQSYLYANGEPSVNNRYKIPEGYEWRAKSRVDGDFVVRATVQDTVVVPINLVAPMGLAAGIVSPLRYYSDITLRVHGVGFTLVGNNA